MTWNLRHDGRQQDRIRSSTEATSVQERKSGNPKGRPKRKAEEISLREMFRKVANEPVLVRGNYGPREMMRWEALIRQLMTMAINGNPRSAALLAEIREAFRLDGPSS